MTSDWVKQSPFTAEIFIFMTVMSIPDNSIKNWDNLKDQPNNIRMINGLPKLIINGFLRKMLSWKSISKKNLVVVKSILKNSSSKMTEKSLNSSSDSKGHHTLYTTSLLMTPLKFVKFRFQTQEKIHSQSLSKDKNFLVNLHSTNQAKHMLKISSKPRNFLLVNI